MIILDLERIAEKLQWLRGQGQAATDALLARSRYLEALCFLEALSHLLPGGLERFCDRLLAESAEWVSSLKRFHMERHAKHQCPAWPEGVSPDVLAWYLEAWCYEKKVEPDAYFQEFDRLFPGFLATLSGYMDRHAKAELAKTADTTLRRRVLLEMDYAQSSTHAVPVVMVADTRHGKTTAVETYCRAWPGKARLVTVPESNGEREFYGAYADAFHVEWTPKTKREDLKARVQFVLRQIGICPVHDEAHRLVPIKYVKETPPQRLEWVRSQIIDRGLRCAFSCTPQSQEDTLARYAAKTHYNLEQWLGRMPKPVLLCDLPTYEDLMLVARNQFPEFSQPVLEQLCDAADFKIGCVGPDKDSEGRRNGDGGLKVIIQAGDRAQFLASQRGLPTVTLDLIREGMEYAGVPRVKPGTGRGIGPKTFSVPAAALPSSRRSAADLTLPGRLGENSLRETTPAALA